MAPSMTRMPWAAFCGPAFVAVFSLGLFVSSRGSIEEPLASGSGGMLMSVAALLMIPWIGLISSQLRRIPGCSGELIYCQAALGGGGTILLLLIVTLWQVSGQLTDAELGLAGGFHDTMRRLLVTPAFPILTQIAVIGIAILCDESRRPLFPRWSGHANLAVAMLLVPCTGFLTLPPEAALEMEGLLIGLSAVLIPAWFVLMSVLLGGASGKRRIVAA